MTLPWVFGSAVSLLNWPTKNHALIFNTWLFMLKNGEVRQQM